ncbi:MAG: hypothetical protein JWR08_685 [Enterovirga sp.]|nr:hypothetical protein [Enterovirga sp.]
MRRTILLSSLALALLAGSPASAQYGGGYGGFDGRPDYSGPPSSGWRGAPREDRYDRHDRHERFDRHRYERQGRYDADERRGRYGYDRRYGYDHRRGPRGVCVTSRGACPAGPRPPGASCGCEIPGFGVKRGIVQ